MLNRLFFIGDIPGKATAGQAVLPRLGSLKRCGQSRGRFFPG